MNRRFAALGAAAALLLSGCMAELPIASPVVGTSTPVPTPTPQVAAGESIDFFTLLEETGAVRRAAVESAVPPDLSAITPNFADQNGLLSREEMENYCTPGPEGDDAFTAKQGQEDVKAAFAMLQNAYGAYEYFGGDDTFEYAKKRALATLSGYDTVTRRQILSALQLCLSFLQDEKVSVGGDTLGGLFQKYLFYNADLAIRRGEEGYVVEQEDGNWLLTAIEGQRNFEEWLMPSITAEGEIVYRVAALASSGGALRCSIKLERHGESRLLYTRLAMTAPWQGEEAAIPPEGLDLPVIPGPDILESGGTRGEIIAAGRELRGKEAVVLDLRGVTGGSEEDAKAWFLGFTGKAPAVTYTCARKFSRLFLERYASVFESEYAEALFTQEEIERKLEPLRSRGAAGEWEITSGNAKWVENDCVVFVLTDKTVSGAGESFIRMLRTLENAVFVGTNTMGSDLTTDQFTYYLPNSRIELSFGAGIQFDQSGVNRDGVGNLPDLYVAPNTALQRVYELCAYYGVAMEKAPQEGGTEGEPGWLSGLPQSSGQAGQ